MNRNETKLFEKIIIEGSVTKEQLGYVMKRLEIIERDLQGMLVRPGNKKSYGIKCRWVSEQIANIKREIETWNKDGLKPDVLD